MNAPTFNIGLCFPRHFKFYAHELVEGMIEFSAEHPSYVYSDLRFSKLSEMRVRLKSANVDGLIIGLNGGEYHQLKKYIPADTPTVNVHPDKLADNIPTVRIDYDLLARQMVEHISGLGFRNIACLSTIETKSARELADAIAAEILNIRINRAKSELISTNLPITLIAENCGFSSHAQFCDTFKRATGVTPRLFRKQVGKVY